MTADRRRRADIRPATIAAGLLAIVLAMASPQPIGATQVQDQERARAGSAVAWLLFVDDLHLAFTDTGRLRELLRSVVAAVMRDGDLVGIVTTGPSSVSVGFTADRMSITHALKQVTGTALRLTDMLGPRDGELWAEVRYRASVSLAAARQAVATLRDVPTTSRFLYVSNGYDIDLTSPASALTESPARRRFFDVPVSRLRERVSELTAAAREAGIAFVALDPRGLIAGTPPDPGMASAEWPRHRSRTRETLRTISAATGGFLIEEDDRALHVLSDLPR